MENKKFCISRMERSGIRGIDYFPIQNSENIFPSKSSEVNSPVISERAFWASFKSSATSSPAFWFKRWLLAFFKKALARAMASQWRLLAMKLFSWVASNSKTKTSGINDVNWQAVNMNRFANNIPRSPCNVCHDGGFLSA